MSAEVLTLADSSARLVLSPADEDDRRVSFYVQAEFSVDGMSGAVDDVLDDGEKTLRELRAMHASMTGSATLSGVGSNPELHLTLTASSNGRVAVDVRICRSKSELKYCIALDQSYLPKIIKAVESWR